MKESHAFNVIVRVIIFCVVVPLLLPNLISSLQANWVFVNLWKISNPESNLTNNERIREFNNIHAYLTMIENVDITDNNKQLEAFNDQLDLLLNQVSDTQLLSVSVYKDIRQFEQQGTYEQVNQIYTKNREFTPLSVRLALWHFSSYIKNVNPDQDLETNIVLEEAQYKLNIFVNEEVDLLGFDVSENTFLTDGASLFTIHWGIVDKETKSGLLLNWLESWDTYLFSNKAYLVGQVPNLVSNSGFERIKRLSHFLSGFRRQYNTPYDHFKLKVLERNDLLTNSLCVTSGGEIPQTGFSTNAIPVTPSNYYLVSAWVKDDEMSDGQALIYSTSDAGYSDVTLFFLPEREQVGSWSLRYDLVQLSQPFARFWLSNSSDSGETCFDNLLFIPIPIPLITHE